MPMQSDIDFIRELFGEDQNPLQRLLGGMRMTIAGPRYRIGIGDPNARMKRLLLEKILGMSERGNTESPIVKKPLVLSRTARNPFANLATGRGMMPVRTARDPFDDLVMGRGMMPMR